MNYNFKFFNYDNRVIYYNIKDIDIKTREINGIEIATAYMEVFNEEYTQFDVFQIYDDKYKVLYAMPVDAQKWYEEYLKEKGENNVF